MNNELDNLLGVIEEPDEIECQKCHEWFMVEAGEYQQKYCQKCEGTF